jgi:hypothetical protein
VIDISSRLPVRADLIIGPEYDNRTETVETEQSPKKLEFMGDFPELEVIHPALDFAKGTLFTAVPSMGLPEGPTINWIVTSRRELFPLERMEMFNRKLHPRVCCDKLSISPRYGGAVVKAFSEGALEGDLLGTYVRVKQCLEACIDLLDDETYAFLTTWIIGTYMFPAFNAFPYIHFNGPRATGKTTSLEVLWKLCFNGQLTPSVTPAAQFRLIEACRPTLLIDEAENLGRRAQNETRAIFLHGYAKGGEVFRVERVGRTWTLAPFEVFCPRAFASQQGFEDTLDSRTVRIPMTRTRRQRPKLDREDVQSIREDCFLASLTCAPVIYDIYSSLDDPEGVLPFFGRDYELFQPSMAIALATGDAGIVGDLTNFAIKSYRRKEAELYESSPEHAFLDFLLEHVVKDGEYPGSVLLRAFKQFTLDNGIKLNRDWTLQLQGTMLANLGLVDKTDKRRAERNHARVYFLSRKKLEEVADNYNLM